MPKKYLCLANSLIEQITEGVYPKGCLLPSEREICEKYKLPRMVFVTDMDIDNASYRQVVTDLQELYGKKIAPFHLPIRENERFVGFVSVVKMKGRMFYSREQNAGRQTEM